MQAERDVGSDLAVLRAPWVWPDFPFILVERRSEMRPEQPFCVVVADEAGEVVPAVYFVDDFPPDPASFDSTQTSGFSYADLAAVVADGWRLVGHGPPAEEETGEEET